MPMSLSAMNVELNFDMYIFEMCSWLSVPIYFLHLDGESYILVQGSKGSIALPPAWVRALPGGKVRTWNFETSHDIRIFYEKNVNLCDAPPLSPFNLQIPERLMVNGFVWQSFAFSAYESYEDLCAFCKAKR